MFGKITILCFAASYAVTLLLEITRLLFRSGLRGAVMLGFAGAGLLAHSLYLAHRWSAEGVAPLSSDFDWCLGAAWALAVFYLYLTWYHPRNPIGLFTLPLVLALVLLAQFGASRAPYPQAEGARLLGLAHGAALLLGSVAVMIGFATGLMYLIQASRLKHKTLPRRGFELPSLEWLQRVNERSIGFSVFFLLGGFFTGVALSRGRHGEVYWSDPVVWTSSALVGWMVLAAAFNLLYKPARHGRKVAYITLATFVFLAVVLAALLLEPGSGHGGRP